MMVFSDNTATNLVADHVGLPATAELMAQLGCPETRLNSKTYQRDTSIFPERSQQYGLGSTTARDMVHLLELMAQGRLVNPAAAKSMYETMLACDDDSKIARDLPPGVKVANKTGEVSASRTDAALLDTPSGMIAICVLTTDNKDVKFAEDNAAHVFMGEIGKVVYEHFNGDDEPQIDKNPVLKMGAFGEIVEGLQRTLNARLDPSPNLGVDGDFGPATQGAVLQFQRAHKLAETGEVTAEMWEALGTLIMEDEPVPPPGEVNSQQLPTAPADDLHGVPFVTCQAWAIGDAETGEVLWDFNGDGLRDPASTTKIMTGYLVTTLAAREPQILEEIITFSRRADRTTGSTSGVKAGEEISVGELLYGLLLPSGNDASVAFAEHFGDRLAGVESTELTSNNSRSYDNFIEAMNRTARELNMSNTSFTNTHGLTDDGHKTTAKDLFRLAFQAMQQPLFAKYVGTRLHGSTVIGPGGYTRNVVWKNTNRLLETDGYQGIKTGTTSAAGSCLVSQASREGRKLIVVVLGSAASVARYTDTRNLYRWAWQQLNAGD